MATQIAGEVAKGLLHKVFNADDISTSPHFSFYVGVTMVAIAAIATAVACGVAVYSNLITQAITVGVVGGVMTGSVALMSFYLFWFSRDHNIVKAGRAMTESLREGQELTEDLDRLIGNSADLRDKWAALATTVQKDDRELASENAALRGLIEQSLSALKQYKARQEKSLQQVRTYTSGFIGELKRENRRGEAALAKEAQLMGKIEAFEKEREEVDFDLDKLLRAREEGRDLLKEMQQDLEEGNKCLRRYTKLCTSLIGALHKDQTEIQAANANLTELLERAGRDETSQKEKLERLEVLVAKLTPGGQS